DLAQPAKLGVDAGRVFGHGSFLLEESDGEPAGRQGGDAYEGAGDRDGQQCQLGSGEGTSALFAPGDDEQDRAGGVDDAREQEKLEPGRENQESRRSEEHTSELQSRENL